MPRKAHKAKRRKIHHQKRRTKHSSGSRDLNTIDRVRFHCPFANRLITKLATTSQIQFTGKVGPMWALDMNVIGNQVFLYANGAAAAATNVEFPAGLNVLFGSPIPNTVQGGLGGNTAERKSFGMYSSCRVLKSYVQITFIPATQGSGQFPVFYLFPSTQPANGHGVDPVASIQNIVDIMSIPDVRYRCYPNQLTITPKPISNSSTIHDILGIQASVYEGSQYDNSILTGALNTPGTITTPGALLRPSWCFGVDNMTSAGNNTTAMDGLIILKHLQEVEFFDRNDPSINAPY